MLGGTLLGFALSIPAGTIGRYWINCAAAALPRHRYDRANVGRKGLLEYGKCPERITLLLRLSQLLPVDKVSLNVGSRQFGCTRHQRLDGVADIVGLVEHVRWIEIGNAAEFCVH